MGIFNIVKKKRPLEETEDFERDIHSIVDFLAHVGRDVKDLYELVAKVKKARAKERSEVDGKKQIKLLEEEIKAWDKFLEMFVMFDRDIDITGERVKKISQILKEEAKTMKIDQDLLKKINKKREWVFNW
ncbi:hypothetical protein CEE44_04960 [Candidatus Woesearchaeota archaeon B3_Woes]|nr:MAG: hypothetical protein CEE44_04960 [Candidatus Woesearchaeota archaeon B3_Woes]